MKIGNKTIKANKAKMKSKILLNTIFNENKKQACQVELSSLAKPKDTQ